MGRIISRRVSHRTFLQAWRFGRCRESLTKARSLTMLEVFDEAVNVRLNSHCGDWNGTCRRGRDQS